MPDPSALVQLQPALKFVVGTTLNLVANQWFKVIDGAVLGIRVKRIMIQLRGTVNGNLYVSPVTLDPADDTAFRLAAPAPVAGPTYDVTFIDEDTSGRCDNHHGDVWVKADTTGMVFTVNVWI